VGDGHGRGWGCEEGFGVCLLLYLHSIELFTRQQFHVTLPLISRLDVKKRRRFEFISLLVVNRFKIGSKSSHFELQYPLNKVFLDVRFGKLFIEFW